MQFPFALDALFYEGTGLKDAELGATYDDGRVNIRLWTLTAKTVKIQVTDTDDISNNVFTDMEYDADTGIWSFSGDATELDRKLYRYEVEVFHRSTGQVETSRVTDPYSLDDEDLKPAGWNDIDQSRPEDVVVYETHIRDISIFDKDAGGNVTPENNGKFRAPLPKPIAPVCSTFSHSGIMA